MDKSLPRIPALDGLRGFAILLVVLFHSYARWPQLIPWATEYKEFPLFKYGNLGVELFFLISGFVIYMTISKCNSYGDFIFKRWIRLFPAMLISTIIIFFSAHFLIERPGGIPKFIDLFVGILFIDPLFFTKLTGTSASPIEGSFWSLFVEVKFYFIFGGLYFLNKRFSIYFFIALFLVNFFYNLTIQLYPPFERSRISFLLFDLLSLNYFGWFAIGALLFLAYSQKNKRFIYISLLLLPPTVYLATGLNLGGSVTCVLIYCAFFCSLFTKVGARIATYKPFLFIGFISYPLYLIHESSMVAFTIKIHNHFPSMPSILTPWPGIILLTLTAFLIAKYAEPLLRKIILLAVGRR